MKGGEMASLYGLKPWYTARLRWFTDYAVRHGVSPDVFTVIGVLGALAAAVCVALGWWPLALCFLAVRLAGANLDGAVARARGVARPWGFVLNEVGDRVSDLVMFFGLAVLAVRVGPQAAVLWVAGSAVAATLPTFVSLAAAGAGGTRRNGGPVGKTERCAAAVLASAVPSQLVPIAVVLAVGSVVTAVVRLVAAYRELKSV
jgi:CDP-diacylglycerol--glycerol-3-phosphate 3-phosphatidyltransferase